jgi:hypothetical protein
MNVLAGRAREGALLPDERAELDSYVHVGKYMLVICLRSCSRKLVHF